MGLANSPSVFQRALNFILRKFINIICLIYLDDIVIFSRTIEEHIIHLSQILTCLKIAGLKVKLSKCQFAQTAVKYLGHIVSADGVRPNPGKVDSIVKFPSPKNVDELKTALGMLSYYRKYIRGYAEIAHPLTKLMKKRCCLRMDIYEELGIRQQRYHRIIHMHVDFHGNGAVEKANRVLVDMITMYAHDNPKSW